MALSLPAPALQVGAVRGSDVVLARGLEVDVARAVARRLGLRLRLVQVGDARRLLRPGRRGWDAALAQLVATPTRTRVSSFTTPYLRDDPVVLVRRGLKRPTSLAQLRTWCSVRSVVVAPPTAADARPAADPSAPRHWSGVSAPSSPDRRV